MLLVQTTIGPSIIHGIGLFADQCIPQGTPVWVFTPGFDLETDRNELARLSEPAKQQFQRYAYRDPKTPKNQYVLCFDDARFFNHADDPNVVRAESPNDEEDLYVAAREIPRGEELTCNSRECDADADRRLR